MLDSITGPIRKSFVELFGCVRALVEVIHLLDLGLVKVDVGCSISAFLSFGHCSWALCFKRFALFYLGWRIQYLLIYLGRNLD
jgi:hypothetical protein